MTLSDRLESLRPTHWPSPKTDLVAMLHQRRTAHLPTAYAVRDWAQLMTGPQQRVAEETTQVLLGWRTERSFAGELSFPVLAQFSETQRFATVSSCLFSLTRLLLAHRPGSVMLKLTEGFEFARAEFEQVIPSGYLVTENAVRGAEVVALADQVTTHPPAHIWRTRAPGQLLFGDAAQVQDCATDWPSGGPVGLKSQLATLLNETKP